MSKEQFQLYKGEGERAKYYLLELQKITNEWQCGVDKKPCWCVYGETKDLGSGVIYWIKPEQGDELVARRIVKLLNAEGDNVRVEMTEWNEERKEKPVYQSEGHKNWMADLPDNSR